MDRQKIYRIYRSIMLVLITFLITLIATTSIMHKNLGNAETKYVLVSDEQSELGKSLNTVRKIIDEYYLGEVDDETLKESALKGYVDGIGDEYTKYVSKKEYEDFSANIVGNYIGIGIYMSVLKDSNEIVILAPMKGSPAEEVGLKSGDIITKVDGIDYIGVEGMETASNNIKGEAETIVHLQIKREEEILEFDITRRKVIMNPIEAKVIENTEIGYIQVTSFDEDISKDFKIKYDELSKLGIKSLIIDLRNNGGGIVQEALNIADYILPKDSTLMITINKKENEVFQKAKQDPIIKIPIVVMVNGNSASASEILVGALKDNGAAKIVGTKTYGKGVIQEVLKLKDGGALKITTEEYFTPNRTKINKTGIEPDFVVENSANADEDIQLNKAVELLQQ